MGTISQKLTYLNDTKTKLKNVINYAGGNITNDTFRSYPEKLYDKFVDFVTNGTDSLYSSLPKVTGEDTELTLNNTANGVLKLDFKGNTSQDGEPTPENPQQIHVVTGDNDVKIENRNLAQYKNGYIIPTTGVFKSSNDDCFYFPVVQGETYYCQSTGNRTVGAIYTSIPVAEQTCIQGTNITDVPKNGSFVASATGIMVVYANTPTSQSVIDTFIVTKGNTAPTSYTSHQEQTYSVNLGTIELCKIGNYQDYIYKENGNWYKRPIILKIASYNGEIITTDYISTTGQLTIGATVYYVNPTTNPPGIQITDTTLIEQLDEIYYNAVSYEDETNISQTNADLPFIISVSAIKKYSE